MNITYNNISYAIPKPFDQCYFGSNPTKELTITNQYSNASCKLPAFAVAIYDTIIGNDVLQYDEGISNKGKYWFQKNFTDEYYILLD